MNSRDTLVTELNVLANFDPIVPAEYQDCEYLMLGNLTPAVQKTVIERLANRPKLIVMDTMNFWMDIAMDDLKAVLQMIDVLCINDEEARQLSGEYSLRVAAKKILGMDKNLDYQKVNMAHCFSKEINYSSVLHFH
jgi:sugar/nucleoside kinase (ribokinase family)